jgi:hypothetical protein
MAKLKGPLFSLSASGAIAQTIVYFAWKGLKVARQYVIPANPKTTAQTTQRGYLTEAVAKIHAVEVLAAHPLDEDDQVAYARLGSTFPTPRTWFNQVCKIWMNVRKAVKIPIIYSDGTISDPTPNTVDLIFYLNEKTGSTLAAGKFYFGDTPSSLINAKTATVSAGVSVALANTDCSAFLTTGVRAYVQFRPDTGDGCQGAVSGIYSFMPD